MRIWPRFAVERQLIRDTFRQARATGIFWMMLTVTGICVALCLSASVSGDTDIHGSDDDLGMFLPGSASRPAGKQQRGPENDPVEAQREGIATISGRMTLAFGAVSIPLGRDRNDAVHFVELLLAWGMAGTFGMLLTLVWTAGFMPGFLEPSTAAVLLTKPIARWRLLLGKYLSVLFFVGFQAVLFIILTWLALGMRTGIWDMAYWWCIPFLLLEFAVFYSFSVFLSVLTRSTVACVFGSLLFWLLAWGINFGSAMARGEPESHSLPSSTVHLAHAAYWMCPKPIDASLILYHALGAEHYFEKPAVFRLLESARGFSPALSILSSLVIAAALLALSAYEFGAKDY